ncbi:hypothetical protein [Candidatus Clavichlamydia salmonicola]|uniref:hypothetical protein n=1 Tax=Candidatus Clavichlamydia salmonicola TaxID=469812 RepID=UPI001890B985|nr:hypothetical protein [Candidatus Clavichlamydia salmonicola]
MRLLFIHLSKGVCRSLRPWSLLHFFCFLPVCLILFSLGIGFLHFSYLSLVLPFISCISLLLCLFYRMTGLILSYALLFLGLYLFLPISSLYWKDLLWYEGLIFSLSLSLYGFFVALEEMDTDVKAKNVSIQEQLQQADLGVAQSRYEAEKVKEQYLAMEVRLEQTLKLKEDLEKETYFYQERQVFIERELHELSEQKGSWLLDFNQLHEEFQQLHAELETIKKTTVETLFHSSQESAVDVKEPTIVVPLMDQQNNKDLDYHTLRKELADKNGMYKQLRVQFNEKTEALSIARKALFDREEELLTLKRVETIFLSEREEETEMLVNCISILGKEVNELQFQINSMEELVSHILSQ